MTSHNVKISNQSSKQPIADLHSEGTIMSTNYDLSLTDTLVRSALAIPEVRNSVREDLRVQGKLPYFSRERIEAISRSIKAEYDQNRV